jgi:hypothetical protein
MKAGERSEKSSYGRGSGSIHDAHMDLDETRRTITELIQYRLSILTDKCKDPDKIKEFRGRALRAINDLFDEEVQGKN